MEGINTNYGENADILVVGLAVYRPTYVEDTRF